jgi:hypothetical protein
MTSAIRPYDGAASRMSGYGGKATLGVFAGSDEPASAVA